MIGWCNLSVLHAALHPIDGAVKLAITAHGAESRPVRRHMLAQFVLITRAASVCRAQHLLRRAILDCQNGRTCQPRTRCWRSICQGANALPYCACPHRCTRLMGQLNLLLPRAELKVGQSDGTCPLIFCLPHNFFPHIPLYK